ncbi:hypothetical protein F5B21DRAFT_455056 [Xylaria acuta]|nr:hypothetical protein F5B21DRAFT_455056 [Xylaria acuta]
MRRKPVPSTGGYLALPNQSAPTNLTANEQLPKYDKATGTRNVCIVGLSLSWAVSITFIALAPWIFRSSQAFLTRSGAFTIDSAGEHTFFLSTASQQVIKLAVNISISICTDCLGYIHATSLRWALEREGRLYFNSNVRLLASTRGCSLNRWSTNIVSAILLMVCYASSSQLFLHHNVAQQQNFVLNGIAITALGVGILGQAIVSTLCLVHSSRLIPTWSSNPLNTALVMLHKGSMQHRPGRCMLPVHSKAAPATPTRPSIRQQSLRSAAPAAGHIVYATWALVVLSAVWSIVVYTISRFRDNSLSPGALYFYGTGVPVLQFNLTALLLVVLFQACITLAIHSVELLVNMSRDENMWRQACSLPGVQTSYGALGSVKAALFSWENSVLFVMKPLIHWLLGLSIGMEDGRLFMNWQGILPLSGLILLLAIFATVLSRRAPSGTQPAAFGHLQSLNDLIDLWPETIRRPIWWGDKGQIETPNSQSLKGIRHAGTNMSALEVVRMNHLYAGWNKG